MPTTLIVYDSVTPEIAYKFISKLSSSNCNLQKVLNNINICQIQQKLEEDRVGQQLRLSMIANTPELPISLLKLSCIRSSKF